jgi:hypothetical protein
LADEVLDAESAKNELAQVEMHCSNLRSHSAQMDEIKKVGVVGGWGSFLPYFHLQGVDGVLKKAKSLQGRSFVKRSEITALMQDTEAGISQTAEVCHFSSPIGSHSLL